MKYTRTHTTTGSRSTYEIFFGLPYVMEETLFWPIEEGPDGYSEQAAILLNEVREWKR